MPLKSAQASGNIPIVRPIYGGIDPIIATDTPTVSAVINAEAVRLSADTDTHFKISGNPTATDKDPIIFGGSTEIIMCNRNDRVSCLKKATAVTGKLWIHGIE